MHLSPLKFSPEYFFSSRENTMMSATAVFNLMSLACARSGHYKVVASSSVKTFKNDPRLWLTCLRGVCDSAPRWVISGSKKLLTRLIVFWLPFPNIVQCSLENATQEDHVWSGLALSLACEGRHLRALVLLKEVRIGFGKFPLASFQVSSVN